VQYFAFTSLFYSFPKLVLFCCSQQQILRARTSAIIWSKSLLLYSHRYRHVINEPLLIKNQVDKHYCRIQVTLQNPIKTQINAIKFAGMWEGKPYVVVKLAEQSNSLVCEKGILTSLLSWLQREANNSPQSSTQANHMMSYAYILHISSRHDA
jgi:hypothetical protein